MSRRVATTIMTFLVAAGGLLVGPSGASTASALAGGDQSTGRVWLQVATGKGYTCGIRTDQTLWCWGGNYLGQLGLGYTGGHHQTPTQVGHDSNWAQVSNGDSHACASRLDHTLWCWGGNTHGVLGLGDTTDRYIPTQLGGTDWNGLSVSNGHGCATRTDDTLWCWGQNEFGQLGLGDTSDRYIPTQVGSGTDWTNVSTGYGYTCALNASQALWCWGWNGYGQLGIGRTHTQYRTTPTQVGNGTEWTHVDTADGSGVGHTCAIQTGHTLWCWGENFDGQLGLHDTRNRSKPRQVGSGTDWTRVSTGSSHTCGTRTNDTLWCWGSNGYGQLGLGQSHGGPPYVPARVGTRIDWAQPAAGPWHTCAVSVRHTLWCWGDNTSGKLGLGDRRTRWVPNRV